MNRMTSIRKFLSQKRIAVVGVARSPTDFSRVMFRELRRRGYSAIPVNPALREVEGVQAFAALTDVPPPVEAVLIMTRPEVTDTVSDACIAIGAPLVWMHRGAGSGSVNLAAKARLEEKGIEVISGECPMMFLDDAPWFHRLHAFAKKIAGTYPKDSIDDRGTRPGST